MGVWGRLFRGRDDRAALMPLYRAIVARARDPFWYATGGVPDTIDGRFDMVAAALSLVLIRLEGGDGAARTASAQLTELFVDDMDAQLREAGIGDVVVGKHVGRMMGALGGRLSAFRAAFDGSGSLDLAVARNLFREAASADADPAAVAGRLRDLHIALAATPIDYLLNGKLPQ